MSYLKPFLLLALILLSTGCQTAYYNTWEKLGWHKRDILVDRVKDARDEQEGAKKQFQTTLQRFKEITNFQGGDLEAKYNKLQADYDRSVARADEVRKQIASVEEVAEALFTEWKAELKQYDNPELRRSSEEKLADTRTRYEQLIRTMKRASEKMNPVLSAFKDQVLFLKHNLNARAIASLQTTASNLEIDVSRLIQDMEASITEANAFISQMKE
jgi:hypothetical protein